MRLSDQPTETKAKFVRKSKAPKEVGMKPEALDYDELIAGASEYVKDIFVANSEDSLMQVNDWIRAPKPFRELMGTRGLPCGLITMAYGKKDCGKTTFATEMLASCQRDGGISILLDTEHKFDLRRAKAMGLERPIIIKATTIEEAFDKFVAMINYLKNAGDYMVDKAFKTKGSDFAEGEVLGQSTYDELSAAHKKNVTRKLKYADRKIVCVWDSLGATPSMAELDDNTTDFSMTAAKVIKGRIRKVLQYISDMKVSFLIINQVYSNMNRFGKQTTPYGGSGPEYHSAIILEFTKMGHIRPTGVKSPQPFCGAKIQVEVVKNHLGQPFKKAEMQIDWRGFVIDREAEYAPEDWGVDKSEPDTSEEVPTKTKARVKAKSK